MARIAGVDLPREKRVEIGLTHGLLFRRAGGRSSRRAVFQSLRRGGNALDKNPVAGIYYFDGFFGCC